jgi:hypothetical protein
MEELTLEELIKYTIRIHQDSFLFYRKAARILQGNEIQTLLDELADFQVNQMQHLKNLLGEYALAPEDIDYMIEVDTNLFDTILESGDIPAQVTPRDVLMLALNRENMMADTYHMILDLPNLEEAAGKLYKLLLHTELEKIAALRTRVEAARH